MAIDVVTYPRQLSHTGVDERVPGLARFPAFQQCPVALGVRVVPRYLQTRRVTRHLPEAPVTERHRAKVIAPDQLAGGAVLRQQVAIETLREQTGQFPVEPTAARPFNGRTVLSGGEPRIYLRSYGQAPESQGGAEAGRRAQQVGIHLVGQIEAAHERVPFVIQPLVQLFQGPRFAAVPTVHGRRRRIGFGDVRVHSERLRSRFVQRLRANGDGNKKQKKPNRYY